MAELEDLFHKHGLKIVAMQEGRSRIEHKLKGAHYSMCMAPASQPGRAHGVQLWIHLYVLVTEDSTPPPLPSGYLCSPFTRGTQSEEIL